VSAELFCLDLRPTGEGLPGNSRRKAQVILPRQETAQAKHVHAVSGADERPHVEQVEFPRKLMIRMNGDGVLLAVVVRFEDVDAALEHEEEIDGPVSAVEQRGAAGQSLIGAVLRKPRRHFIAQARKGLSRA